MKKNTVIVLLLVIGWFSQPCLAKIDLVTLPSRDLTQLTIYNSADLTLVRDERALTLKEGHNRLQFSWANTLIDPTSLEMLPKSQVESIDIFDLIYPARVNNVGIWQINSQVNGKIPVEMSYLTSGIHWRAFYMATLGKDEQTMQLKGYVRVSNNSGEDYEKAQVRLIVGKINLLDQIATLARRKAPYGRPGGLYDEPNMQGQVVKKAKAMMAEALPAPASADMRLSKKEIKKEGLSEYFLYTIEGTETIPTGWSKRLPSFKADNIPVESLYKYEKQRYGDQPVRFIRFSNDKTHKMGQTPIPGGTMKVFRQIDDRYHLNYEGQSAFKYIPVDEEVELSLGPTQKVIVTPKLMEYRTDNYLFDRKGQISGWDEIRTFQYEVDNTRNVTVKVEIKKNLNTNYWDLKNKGAFGIYTKEDKDTVKYSLALEPQSKKTFEAVLTTYHGNRQDDH